MFWVLSCFNNMQNEIWKRSHFAYTDIPEGMCNTLTCTLLLYLQSATQGLFWQFVLWDWNQVLVEKAGMELLWNLCGPAAS